MKFSVGKILAAALSLLGISALSGASACAVKSTEVAAPVNCVITKTDPPADGSLPTAHTGTENLAYISKVFERQTEYHAYSYTYTNAAIATQVTRSYRDYKNGIMIASDITYSSVVKSGTQKCTVFNEEKGEYEVYARSSGEPKSTTNSVNAEWSTEAPLYYSEYAYTRTYGLLQTELTNLILNDDSVIESGEVHANPDGTYTQSFVLDPVVSAYYYAFCMKTNGGLSGYPSFQNVTLSVTFTDKWLPLSITQHDVSSVNKGVVVTSVSDTVCEFTYGGVDEEHFAFYDSYFKGYLGDEDLEQAGGDVDEALVVDVTNVLSNGFSKIMDGGAQYELEVSLGKNVYRGFAFVALDLANPLETLEIRLSLGKTLREQGLYVEYKNGEATAYYGNDFALDVNIAALKPVIGEITGWAEELAKGFNALSTAGAGSEEGENGDMLADLMKAMTLETNGGEATLSLKTDDLLGLGVGIDVQLYFGVEAKSITFRGGVVGGLSLGGSQLDLGVVLRSTTAEIISREKTDATASLTDFAADAFSLISSDLLKINAKLDGDSEGVNVSALKGLQADVTAYVDVDGVTVGAEAAVSYNLYGNKLSAVMDIRYDYDVNGEGYGKAILSLKQINGAPVSVQVKCDIAELVEAIGTALAFGGAENGVAADGVVDMINSAFTHNFASLLTKVYADKMQIKLGVNVDTVLSMLGVNAGVKFGSCTLAYVRGEGVYGGELSAALPAIGFGVTVSGAAGEIEQPDTTNCLDLSYLLEDINGFVNAELYEVKIDFDGDKIEKVKGLKANLTAYADIKGLAVYANVKVSYAYDEMPVSAELSAWYAYDGATNGTVVLSLDKLNGVATCVRVSAEIDKTVEAVRELLAYCNVRLDMPELSGNIQLEEVLTGVLAADLSALIPELATTADGLKLGVNVDEALKLFNVDMPMTVGTVNLAYSHANCNLTASVPALGLGVTVNALKGKIVKAPTENVLDLAELIELVNGVINQVNGIIEGECVSFEIPDGKTYLYLDGITVNLWGKGEVSWKSGNEYVALDLSTAIAENGLDVTHIKLLYAKNAEGKPLVRLALNEVGIDIYPEDIQAVTEGFARIYEKIASAFGISINKNTPASGKDGISGSVDLSKLTANDKLMTLAFGLLSSDGWVEVLNDMTLTVDKQVVTANGVESVKRSLLLSYAADGAAEVGVSTDGNIALYYGVNTKGGFEFGGEIQASTANGSLVAELDNAFDSMNISSSKEGSSAFIKLAYDFLFEAVSNVSVKEILGSDTYAVKFALIGNNCNIERLEGVNINAEVYFTGASGDDGKLAEADLNIEVAGVVVSLNVITERVGSQTYFFINLRQVVNFALPDLKLKATQSSLYETIETLISAVNNTDIMDVLGGLLPGGAKESEQAATLSECAVKTQNDAPSLVADILEKILNFSFEEAVEASKVDGVTTAVFDLDNIAGQFGFESEPLGTVEIVINHKSHSMKTSGMALVTDAAGVTELKEWISLSSEKTAARDYSKLDRSRYISIEFLPTLIDDVIKFATDDNGRLHDTFTLSGNIDANLVGMIDVNINPCTLTVKPGENGLSLSAVMHVNKAKVLGIGIPESTVGITYRNGLLTLAKGLNTATPQYKVMTFDYFLDHMLTKKDSVLNWLLDISGWDLIMSFVKTEINSGLTSPEDISLFEKTEIKEDREISMYDFVDALRVVLNGKQTAVFGNYDALESDLGVYDNYYGFALNAGLVTNGVLTKLNAAITRSESGLERIIASGAIQSYVKFSANLKYEENRTEEYELGTTLTAEKIAPDLYQSALDKAAECGYVPDFDYFERKPERGYDEKFGCTSVLANNGVYTVTTDYSHLLNSHTLTIITENGAEERLVRHGSTVRLFDNEAPVYTDNTKEFRILYSTSPESVGAPEIIMNGDLTVYALVRRSVNVIFASGGAEYVATSFEGDGVPHSVSGLDTIEGPFYEDGTQVGANDEIPAGISVLKLHGTFVKSEVIINYVKYAFDAQTNGYVASGKAAGFNDYYSVRGNTLVLENEIDGYPVTAIAELAFANTEGKPIRNIVVPSNITTVGEKAFLDNTDMQSVVFLAENVTFLGKDGNGKTMPFYGCSVSENEEKTALSVYYNNITADGGNWRHFRYVSKVFAFNFYVGDNGGELHGGNWCVLDVEVTGAELVEEMDFGAYISETVASGLKLDSDYTQADAEALSARLIAFLSEYRNEADGDKYVVKVALKSTGARSRALTVAVTLNQPRQITVHSAVEFTYTVGSLVQYVEANADTAVYTVSDGDSITLFAPQNEDGYVFLGWAEEINGEMTFVGETVAYGENTVYYAIWGFSKVGQEVKAQVNYGGNAFASTESGNGKWYDNDWNEVKALSKENTVVYTRAVFKLTLKVSGGTDNGGANKKTFYYKDDETYVGEGKACDYGEVFAVLEGEIINLTESGSKWTVSGLNGSVTVYSCLLTRKSWVSSWGATSTLHAMSATADLTVDGDTEIEFIIN